MLSRISAALFLAASFAMFVGCGPRATEAECKEMIEHMTEVQLEGLSEDVANMTREMMKDTQKELMGECVGKASQAEVKCILAAKSEAEMAEC